MEKNINMKKICNVLGVLALVFGPRFFAEIPLASAQVQKWSPRTLEVIKQEFEKNIMEKNIMNGVSGYIIQREDALQAISLETDLSIQRLMEFNRLDNSRLIDIGIPLYFSQSKKIVSIENNQVANTDDVVNQAETISQDNNIPNEVSSKWEGELLDGHTTTPYTQEPSEEIVLPKKEIQQLEVVEQIVPTTSPKLYALRQFMFDGIIYWGGLKFTYYSQSVLPGGGLRIPGRHVNADGYVADADGYIVLANDAPLGTIINTPFGYKGKVYDRGTVGNHFDVYIR